VRAALALRRLDPADPRLDAETFGSWLTRHGQSAAAIDRLWNLIALPTLNLPASEASLLLATKVFREGLLDATDAGDVGWSLVPLRELHGTNALRALKDAGVDVRLATKVTSIDDGGGRLVAQTPDGGVDADAVVVATPPAVAASLGALRPASVAARLGTSPIVNVHLLFDRRVTEHTMFATVDSPLQFVFDRSATCGLTEGQCLSVSLSAADAYLQVGATELAETCVAALHALLPAARQATLVDAVVTREHAATFRGVPGTDALRPGPITSRRGVLLAGAWCATGWPATMEGAVRSGHAAASAALDVAAGATPLELTGDLTGDLTGGAPTTVGRVAS